MVFLGGQFKSATHGQFKSAQGGQFDRILQITEATLDFSGMRKYLCDKLSESSTSLNFV